MKKGLVIGVILILFLSLVFGIYFLKKDTPNEIIQNSPIENTTLDSQVKDTKLISYAESCEGMMYPGAYAFTHGGDPPCDHVYNSAFYDNNSDICNYLEQEDKAICLGSSITSWGDKNICNALEGDYFEICLLNVLYKLDELDLISKIKEVSICSDFQNSDLIKVCNGYQNYINEDYSSCIIGNSIDTYCVYSFILLNQESSLTKSLCKEAFEDHVDRFKCLFDSKAIYYNWFNESVEFGEINDNGINKNVSFLFTEIYVETEYPILLRYVKSYWQENPNYVEGSGGLTSSQFIKSTDMDDYICMEKIKELSEIENCIPYNWSELFDTSIFPKVHWKYDAPYNY